MAVFRFLAGLLLLVAMVALVADLTPVTYGSGPFHITSLGEHWTRIAPATKESARVAVSEATFPWVWDSAIEVALAIPTFLFFGLLTIGAGYLGRRRHRVNVYIN